MKLQNKSTGEIGCLVCSFGKTPEKITVVEYIDGKRGSKVWYYNSLAELNEEWEDYEEPESKIIHLRHNEFVQGRHIVEIDYTDYREAERAVKKLEAWKRLKDKGFRFIDHIDRDSGQGMTRYEWDGYVNGEDLDLLFSGEDD